MKADAVNIVIGLGLIAGALGLICYLTLWSRKRIDRIAREGFGSAREILRNSRRGR